MSKNLGRLLLLLAPLLAFTGCTPAMLVNAFVQRSSFDFKPDLAYGSAENQTLDLYLPKGMAKAPVLLFVHGGSWYNGDKSEYPFLGEAFSKNGYLTAVINYRKAPQVQFPAFVQDAAMAVRWVIDHIAEYGGDPNRIYLMGQSAGAQIAALVALDPRYLQAVGLERSALKAFIGQAGPYDFRAFLEDDKPTQVAMGPREQWPLTQPINFVDGKQPPMLLQHGLSDTVVNPKNPDWLSELVKQKGGEVAVKYYPGVDHYGIIGALSGVGRFLGPQILPDLLDFLAQHS